MTRLLDQQFTTLTTALFPADGRAHSLQETS